MFDICLDKKSVSCKIEAHVESRDKSRYDVNYREDAALSHGQTLVEGCFRPGGKGSLGH